MIEGPGKLIIKIIKITYVEELSRLLRASRLRGIYYLGRLSDKIYKISEILFFKIVNLTSYILRVKKREILGGKLGFF